ncbi:bitesize isoform, putative [Ixodes scapularis]|uniref:Bitesize isoform, putative n=1 Tax=Ixodes scapularis TaxID=6945 RepID=B7QBQ5_IXOSC|nr:bitesize isoform, putative [Ixodes scapularis]|eukprot:XP_002412969.1 bitesize isoform, putative [Ixodes scapularis]
MDRAACESLPCTPTDPDDSPPFPILPPPLVFDDFLFSRDAHGDPNHATLTGEPLSVPTNAPSPPCSPLARRLDQLRRRSFRIRDLLKNSDSELPSRPASQNSYDSRLWQFEDSDCEVKLKDRSPDDYKLVFISSDSSEEDSEAEASRVWLLLRSRLALGPEGSVYVEDTSDWEFASDEDDWALSCSSDGGSDSCVAGGGAPCCAAEERQGVGAGPQVVDPEQRSPEEARGEKGLGERGAAGRMGGRVGPEGTPSDDDDQDPTCFSAVVAILAEQRVPDNRRDESLPANLHAVRGGGTAGVGEPGQEVCPAAGLAAAPPVVDSAAPEAGEGSGADDDAIAGRPRDSLARDDAIMVDRVPLTLARGPEPIAAGPSADGCPREEAPRQRASEEQQPAADNAPETAIANMADALRDTGQGVREVGQLEESGAPAAANPQMSSAAAGTEGVATAAVDIAVDADAATDPEPAAARECVVHQQVAAVCVSDCEAGVDLDAEDATQATCAPATTADSASESTVGEFAPGGSKSNDSVSVVVDAVVSADVTDSVLDSVLDTPVMREKCVDLEGLVVSTLEKYFTESFECHDSGSDVHRDASSIRDSEIRAVPSAPSATPPASSETALRSNEASDASCDEEEEEEGMFSDASTSSDDAMYISPMPRLNPAQYGNPLSYSLHTILEESCEESERSSRATTPITKNPSSELEKYFSFAIGNASLEEIHKRWSVATSEEFSDSVSETSGVDDIEVMDEDPAVLASSRLEKYFTSGLLGNGLFHYPDDAEYTDESGGVSNGYSDEEAAYIVNRVIAHISGTSDEAEKMDENITPWKALLESQITRLMQTVSPAALSGESSCSSTIGSNNSDYGSSDLDFCGSVETVLEVCPKAGGISPEPSVSPTGTSADKSRSESSLYIKARKGLSQRKLVVTRSSDSLAPYKKASGESRLALQLFRSRGTSKSEHSIPDTTTSEDKEDVSDANRAADGLAKRIGSKEKSSSENNLSLATFPDTERTTSKFLGTKSVGNITDLEGNPGKSSCFRDTGYYSFKSSEESVLSLDDPGSRPPSGSLTKQKSLQSSETIPEVEEEPVRPARTSGPASAKTNSLSSGSIPDSVFAVNSDCKSNESSGSHRSSPRNRLRGRNRHSSGGSDDSNRLLPTISIVGADETSSMKSSADSTDRDSSHRDEELERLYTSCSRSQTSLSSIGVSVRSESMTSVYSAAGGGRYGTVAVTGEALFAIVYNYKSGLLEVHVKECRNLAPVDTKRNRSDPYVKVYLLPDKTKSGKRKTKVKKHTLNPVFEEVLKFRVTMSELQARTLWLSVWHSDMFGRNDFLGEVMLPLTYDTLEKTDVKCYSLQERFESPETPLSYKGDLVLALKYMPPDVTHRTSRQGPIRGSLHVLVKEARNLMATRSNGTSDPFCKSYLLPDRTKGSKQKTPVVKKSCNPKWNHTFVYPDVSLEELKDRCLELTVWDYDKITSNDFLGGVRLGLGTGKLYGRDVDWMDSQGEELTLWRSMLERPNLWIDGSLLLRPTLQSKR